MTTEKAIVRNTAVNLVAQLVPPIVAIVSVPFMLKGLGSERFGALSLLLALIGYSALLELGLSRALTKFAAEHLAAGDHAGLGRSVYTTLWVQAWLGALSAVTICASVGLIVRVMNVPPALEADARIAVLLLAPVPAMIFGIATFTGLLAAGSHFRTINALQVLSSALTYGSVALLTYRFHVGLAVSVALMVAVKVLTLAAFARASFRAYPELRTVPIARDSSIRRYLSFGGWVAIGTFAAQLLTRVDRFLVGKIVSLGAVTYYAVPYDALSRLYMVPGAVVTTLFPAMSALMADPAAARRIDPMYARAMKFLIVVLAPLSLLIAFFAHELLTVWVGAAIAEQSTVTMQIIAISIPFASVAWVPYTLLQSAGRPDLPAKLLAAESVLHLVIAITLISRYRWNGAAIAWTLRTVLDLGLQLWLVRRLQLVGRGALRRAGVPRATTIAFAFGAALLGAHRVAPAGIPRIAAAAVALLAFVIVTWTWTLDAADRNPFERILNKLGLRSVRATTVE